MTAALRRSFDSLSVPNFRRYFKGQVVSLSGNWMQTVAEVWLILSLTGSGFAVGIATALQFLPIMLFGAWGGSLADRFAKRDLLMVTQAMMMVPPLILLGVTVAGVVTPAMVFALILIRGSLLSVDNPARQAFVMEMVGPDRIVNAVSLNSVIVHSARVAGPAVAGILIATVGVAPCFGLNAATFLVMIWALRGMDRRRLAEPPKTNSREPGRVRAAVRHVMQTPELAMPLMLMAVVGTLGLNFQVILPLLARLTFEGGASSYAVLVSSMGAGSVIGALVTGARGKTGMGDRRLRPGLWRPGDGRGADAQPRIRDSGSRPARSFGGDLRRGDQFDHPAGRGAGNERPGHGPVFGRIPGLNPDRRTAGRLHLGIGRSAACPRPRVRFRTGRCRGRLVDKRPQPGRTGTGDDLRDGRSGLPASPPVA